MGEIIIKANLVKGPSSVISGNAVLFDGTTGKLIKDAGFVPENISNKVTDLSTNDNTHYPSTQAVQTAINNAIAGVDPAVAASAATIAASDTSGLTYNNGVGGIGAFFTGSINTPITFDGFTFSVLGQRALIKNDTQSPSGAFNGIYYVTQLQTALLPPILTRALDFNQPSNINNTGEIPITNGTANINTSWVVSSTVNTVGTDAITFSQFSIAPSTIVTLTGTQTLTNKAISGSTNTLTNISLTTSITGILPVTNGGSGTSTAFTQGSLIFAGASGVYSQDNANFFWDDTNFRLGIKTTSPGNTLSVNAPSTADALAEVLINARIATQKSLVLQGFTSQSANILEVQDSTGTANKMMFVTSNGSIKSKGHLAVGSSSNVSVSDILAINDAPTGISGVVALTTTSSGMTCSNNGVSDGRFTGIKFYLNNVSSGGSNPKFFGQDWRLTPSHNSISGVDDNYLTQNFVGSKMFLLTGSGFTGTISDAYHYQILSPGWNGSVPTLIYGFDIANLGTAGTTSSYGINIQAQSGSTNNYAITSDVGNKHGFGTLTPANTVSVNTPTTADLLAETLISSRLATQKALVLQGVASQSANLLSVQDSTGVANIMMSVNSTGSIFTKGHLAVGNTSSVASADIIQINETLTGVSNPNLFNINVISNNTGGATAAFNGFKFNLTAISTGGTGVRFNGINTTCTLDHSTVGADDNYVAGRFVGEKLQMLTTSSFTGTIIDAYIYRMLSPSFSGTKPTTNYGLDIQNQGLSGITTSIGINILAQSGSTNNYAIVSDAGNKHGFGTLTPTEVMHIVGNILSSGTTTLSALSTTGIVHNSAAGLLSTSLIVNADITNSTIDLTTKVTGILPSANGGTGVNNSFTITLSGNLVTTGAFNTTFATGFTGTLTLPTATDTLMGRASTDTFTNKTFNTAGTGNVFQINGVGITAVTGTGSVVLATTPTLVTPIIGVATGTSLAATGLLTSSSPTAGIGYATGAGGTVTQATSKSTGVTLNTNAGAITMNGAALANNVNVGFTLTNSAIAATDVIILNIKSGATTNSYTYSVDTVAAGSCHIMLRNVSGGSLSEAVVINYCILKGVTA